MNQDKKNILGLNRETFCSAPWIEGHIAVSGDVLPCCYYDPKYTFGNVKEESFKNLINNKKATKLRKDLYTGVKHPGCINCWNDEKLFGSSYRTAYNKGWKHNIVDALINTYPDFTLKDNTLQKLDLRFDNKCNLKCRICGPHFSTSWFKDARLLEKEGIQTGVEEHAYSISISDELFYSLLETLEGVKCLYFAGGEPLIQDKHYQILEYAIEKGYSKNITLQYNTNFSNFYYKGKSVLDLWPHFEKVICTASLDDSGKRVEYHRKNLFWDRVLENRELLYTVPNVFFNIYATVSIFNVFHILEFIEDWVEKDYIEYTKDNGFVIGMLQGPDYLNITNLTDDYKARILKVYDEFYIKHKEDTRYTHIFSQLDKVTKYLKQERLTPFEKWVKKFLKNIKVLDKIRAEYFLDSFPEYCDLFSSIDNNNPINTKPGEIIPLLPQKLI